RMLGGYGLDEAEVPGVLVVEAARHSAAQLQPVLLELPHVCPFLVPGRAVCPALGTGGRWTPWHAERAPGASDRANEVGRGSTAERARLRCRVGWRALAAGGRACQEPSGQIPPPWAWWENEAPTTRAACSSAQAGC